MATATISANEITNNKGTGILESFVIDTRITRLKITLTESEVESVELASRDPLSPPKSTLAKQAAEQLLDLIENPKMKFEISILRQGTAYQQKVWQALRQIPVGQVLTYGQLAKQLNSSARAIGNACRRNPTPLIVPCHRVVSATGLGGFAGETKGELTRVKRELLRIEGVEI